MINGRACAGKDVIADYLVDEYGFHKITFATPIYVIAKEYFGMHQKDRSLLQSVGQKMREIKSSVWVDYAFKIAEQHKRVVISDIRQANEYEKGVAHSFFPIRVSADLNTRIERCKIRDGIEPDTSLWENGSEIGADDFNYIEVENNGTLGELYKQIDAIVRG